LFVDDQASNESLESPIGADNGCAPASFSSLEALVVELHPPYRVGPGTRGEILSSGFPGRRRKQLRHDLLGGGIWEALFCCFFIVVGLVDNGATALRALVGGRAVLGEMCLGI
jgi:hypothetical protein